MAEQKYSSSTKIKGQNAGILVLSCRNEAMDNLNKLIVVVIVI